MVAKYKVLDTMFVAPILLGAGSVIAWTGTPGPHLAPLNEEAEAAFEAWYATEFPKRDKDGVILEGQTIRPLEQFRSITYTPGDTGEVTLLQLPPKDTVGGLSLVEAQFARPSLETRDAPVPPKESYDGTLLVEKSVAPPRKVA